MKRYAASDFHGYYDLYEAIKKKLNVDDLLYVLGDCADRGPHGWETLTAVIKDPQCVLILGNHEAMLRDTMAAWYKIQETLKNDNYADEDVIWTREYELLAMNGGNDTFWNWRQTGDDMYMWYQRLQMLPLEYQVFDSCCGRPVILTHAGYTIGKRPKDEEDIIWNRNHFFENWDETKPIGNAIVIHGHTPQEYLVERLVDYASLYDRKYIETDFKIIDTNEQNEWHIYDLTYSDGHKICIDPGTVISKRGLIINLDTLEQEVVHF